MELALEMALEMAEVIAVRKITVVLILLSIPLIIMSAEQLLIFSEAGSGLRLEKLFADKQDTELFTTLSTELQTPSTRVTIDGSVYSFANFDSLSHWQAGIGYEQLLPLVDFSMAGHFLDDEDDSLDVMSGSFQFFKQRESRENFSEYGLGSKSNIFFENDAFSHLEFNLYYIYKKYYVGYTVHHDFNAVTKHFSDIDPMLDINYQVTFSFPTSESSGLSLSYFINYNPISNDRILYLHDELFDLFSYNMHKVSIEYTTQKGNLLCKPWLVFNSKEYLTTAVEQPYSEFSFLAGFYADWLWANGSMIYAEGFYQTIAQDRETAYEFRTGIKFQFDLKSR